MGRSKGTIVIDPQRSAALIQRAEKAMAFENENMADPERLYYHVQRYLLLKDDADHRKIRELYTIAGGLKDNLYLTPGYSLNDDKFDNPAYILSYILEKEVPVDRDIVDFFKQAIKDAADANIAELRRHAVLIPPKPPFHRV